MINKDNIYFFTITLFLAFLPFIINAIFVSPFLYINLTDSAPKGIYCINNNPPLQEGDFCIINKKKLITTPHWCPEVLLKHYYCASGTFVKVNNSGVYINNNYICPRPDKSQQGNSVPLYFFSGILNENQAFLLNETIDNSFDSRHFGPVNKNDLTKVVLIWKF